MGDILRFISLPAIVILAVTWWVVLKHRLSMLLPFLLVMVAVIAILRLFGLSPLVFFVSPGGYVIFAALAWIAAAVVRDVAMTLRR